MSSPEILPDAARLLASSIRSLTLARDVPIMTSTVYGSHTVSIRRKDSEKEPSSPVMTVVW
jgi:hypothetical protein